MTGILRSDVELIHGERPMLFDRCADAYFNISEEMLDVLALLTESLPISQFMKLLHTNGITVTQEQLIQLLAFLQQNNLLIPEYGHIGAKRERQAKMKEKTAFLRFTSAYLFFKLPPWRPEQTFTKIAPYVSWLASKWMIILLAIPAIIGYLLMVRDFGNVRATFVDTLSWAGLAKYFVAILFLKFVHEAAHSIAAIHFNCRVRGLGVGFMVFYPRLYTDTTDSWRLPRKQRLLIDSAGIIIELLLGGIAVLLWTYLPPGTWKSTMFYVFAVSTISTLFVNGNPCIRYDGYYILCDLMNIDNLMTRSSEYVKQFWRWYFLRLGSKPQNPRGMFLLTFGVCSFIYRIFLYTSIILVIYHSFVKALAVVLVFLELYSIVIYPFWTEIQTVRALSKRSATKAKWFFVGFVLLFAGLILFLPLRWNISLPGEVVPVERQLVTIQEGGYLQCDLPRRAFPVEENALIFTLDSPQLFSAIESLKETQRYDEILYNLQVVDTERFADAQVTLAKIISDKVGLKELSRRQKDLNVRAGMNGIFVSHLPSLSKNAYLGKGQRIGEIVSEKTMIYAFADDRQIAKLNLGDTATINVKDTLRNHEAKVTAINRIATKLHDSPLLQHFGGPVPVYIEEGRMDNYSSVLALYRIELTFDEPPELDSGRVVTVKIHHSEQLYKPVFQFILSAFRKEF